MPWWGGGGSQKGSPAPSFDSSGGGEGPGVNLEDATHAEEQLRSELEAKAGPSLAAWEAAKAELDLAIRRDSTVGSTFSGLPNPSQVRLNNT